MLHNLLVAPVKNPPVAISTTKQRSASTFLSLVSLTFLVQLVIIGRQGIIYRLHRIICGSPPIICGSPPVICGSPPITCGSPPITCGRPPVICGTPPVICGTPQITQRSPPITQRGGYLPFWNRFVANLSHSLNKYPPFHLLNL